MSHAPTDALSRRHDVLRQALAARALDALVVTSLPNILYLTNFTGSSAIVVVTADRLLFVTDFRYLTAIDNTRGSDHACPGLELVIVDGAYDVALARLVASRAESRIGFEGAHLSVSRHQWLGAALAREGQTPKELVATEGMVEHARARKDGYEVATLREGARRLSAVARGAFHEVRAGRTEREVAAAIDWRIHAEGFAKRRLIRLWPQDRTRRYPMRTLESES